jgi:hypothetical protein
MRTRLWSCDPSTPPSGDHDTSPSRPSAAWRKLGAACGPLDGERCHDPSFMLLLTLLPPSPSSADRVLPRSRTPLPSAGWHEGSSASSWRPVEVGCGKMLTETEFSMVSPGTVGADMRGLWSGELASAAGSSAFTACVRCTSLKGIRSLVDPLSIAHTTNWGCPGVDRPAADEAGHASCCCCSPGGDLAECRWRCE